MDNHPTIRIAINGFGRIGRCLVRALSEHPARERFELVAINDLADFNVLAPVSYTQLTLPTISSV